MPAVPTSATGRTTGVLELAQLRPQLRELALASGECADGQLDTALRCGQSREAGQGGGPAPGTDGKAEVPVQPAGRLFPVPGTPQLDGGGGSELLERPRHGQHGHRPARSGGGRLPVHGAGVLLPAGGIAGVIAPPGEIGLGHHRQRARVLRPATDAGRVVIEPVLADVEFALEQHGHDPFGPDVVLRQVLDGDPPVLQGRAPVVPAAEVVPQGLVDDRHARHRVVGDVRGDPLVSGQQRHMVAGHVAEHGEHLLVGVVRPVGNFDIRPVGAPLRARQAGGQALEGVLGGHPAQVRSLLL